MYMFYIQIHTLPRRIPALAEPRSGPARRRSSSQRSRRSSRRRQEVRGSLGDHESYIYIYVYIDKSINE